MANDYQIHTRICARLCDRKLCSSVYGPGWTKPFVCGAKNEPIPDAVLAGADDSWCIEGQWNKYRTQAAIEIDARLAELAADAVVKAEAEAAAPKQDAEAVNAMLKALAAHLEIEIPLTPEVLAIVGGVVLSDEKPLLSQDAFIELGAIAKTQVEASK
jgi:hypothetical protein